MKTIGLLGGIGWLSTMTYYKILNEFVQERLGEQHSAKILLKSFDCYDIRSNFRKNDDRVAILLEEELRGLIALKPDCILICCNTLHKYYDTIKDRLSSEIPVLHAVELVALEMKKQHYKKALLLATKNTLEDGFFAKKLEECDIEVTIPNQEECLEINEIKKELMQNIITEKSRSYFAGLITKHKNLNAVILGCSVFPLIVDQESSSLPIIDPMILQARAAVDYALAEHA